MVDALNLHEKYVPGNERFLDKSKNNEQAKIQRLKKLEDACSQLESVFVNNLMKAMRGTIPGAGVLPETPGSDIYLSMADQQMALYLSKGNGIGLGKTIFNQILRREDPDGLAGKDPDLKTATSVKRVSPDFMPDRSIQSYFAPQSAASEQ